MSKSKLRSLLDQITNKEYLTINDMLKLLSQTDSFYYAYDFISCFSDWKITPKGFTAKDGIDNTIQFNDKRHKHMLFYKSGFLVA